MSSAGAVQPLADTTMPVALRCNDGLGLVAGEDDMTMSLYASKEDYERAHAARWYCVDRDGVAMLCNDEDDARAQAVENDYCWPGRAPHRAVLLGDVAAERERWEEALRKTWRMVDPLRPAGTPGSYARGQDSGIVAALETLRQNLGPNAL